MSQFSRTFPLLLALSILPGVWSAQGAQDAVRITAPRFMGEPSCQSSSCHGGGTGKDQCLIWNQRDFHARAQAVLGATRTARMAEALGIPNATKDARCTVCHSPQEPLPPGRFAAGVKPDVGVSCETCHGPAENWLRFHTRTDVTHEQRSAAGLREMHDLYSRANVCVACHLNIDAELVRAGHPELLFELDGQMRNQPPHWREIQDPWLGPRAWLVGQAADLRELSWKVAANAEPDLLARQRALHWLLGQTQSGQSQLPPYGGSPNAKGLQSAADRLARNASKTAWNRDTTAGLLRKLAETSAQFRDQTIAADEHRRRAETLVLAVDRLWQAMKANKAASPTFDTALAVLAKEARTQQAFDPERFAAALQQIEVALELMPKSP